MHLERGWRKGLFVPLTFNAYPLPPRPSRVRGLKPLLRPVPPYLARRTLTGAWIETGAAGRNSSPANVAPSRVRGLKQIAR